MDADAYFQSLAADHPWRVLYDRVCALEGAAPEPETEDEPDGGEPAGDGDQGGEPEGAE